MLSVLKLSIIYPLLVFNSVFFGLDKVLIVAPVTVQPLGVQVDDVRYHGIEEVTVVGHYQDGGLPRLRSTNQMLYRDTFTPPVTESHQELDSRHTIIPFIPLVSYTVSRPQHSYQ